MNFFKTIAAVVFLAAAQPAQAKTVIKFATLAPKGSTWMNAMDAYVAEVSKQTGGEVEFKIYAGGVQGDEKDVVRKIRLGQLHAGGFTGVGIGEVAPELRVLDVPFLFKSEAEVDCVYKAYDAELRKIAESKGYIVLGWPEVGFVYLFSAKPVRTVEELRDTKMWMWEGDPIAESVFKEMNVSPVPLSVADVMTSLQTGLINGVYGSPLSVVAMQWFTKVNYMLSLPFVDASGAVLVSKKMFDTLTPAQQKTLVDLGNIHFPRLTQLSREDNKKAVETLKKEGIKVLEPSADSAKIFSDMGARARKSLSGKLYPEKLIGRIEKSLSECSSAKKAVKK